MPQTLYLSFESTNPSKTGSKTVWAGLIRWVERKWDLILILALMAASLAYGVFAVAPMA